MTKQERQKDLALQRKYGINLQQYNEMLRNQHDCCKICRKDKSNFKRALAVDHDHRTGEVRGLLCYRCNKFIVGRLDKDSVLKLIAYLLPNYILVKIDVDKAQKSCQTEKKRKNNGKKNCRSTT